MSRIVKRVLAYDRDEMARRGRIGARVAHARHGPEQTAPARAGLAAKRQREREAAAAASPDDQHDNDVDESLAQTLPSHLIDVAD